LEIAKINSPEVQKKKTTNKQNTKIKKKEKTNKKKILGLEGEL